MASVLSAPLLESSLVVPRKPIQILTIFWRWDGSTLNYGTRCLPPVHGLKDSPQSLSTERFRSGAMGGGGGGPSATDSSLVGDSTAGLTI